MPEQPTASATPYDITDTTGPLHQLARAYGVLAEYESAEGDTVRIPDRTVAAVLTALGARCETHADVEDSLRTLDDARFARALPAFAHQFAGERASVDFILPKGERFELSLLTETGSRVPLDDIGPVTRTRTVMTDGTPQLRQERTVRIPADLPLGEHTLTLTSGHRTDTMPFVVAPRHVPAIEEITASQTSTGQEPRRPWGITVQLYSLRSRISWGIGEFGDLRDLMAITADMGADFVLINPIHAQVPEPPVENSPYLPSSRQAIDPIYIRIEDIPEAGHLDSDQRLAVQSMARRWGKPMITVDPIDRDGVIEDKITALELLFTVPMGAARRKQFDRFVAEAPLGMRNWAVFNAVYRHTTAGGAAEAGRTAGAAQRTGDGIAPDAVRILASGLAWPSEMPGPEAEAVRRFETEHAAQIEFWMWTQFVAAEQLRAAQRAAVRLGMRIGLITDLAVGVSGNGADSWALGDFLAQDASVGAPADYYNQQGQDWSQPPWHPMRLADAGYTPLRDLFRTAFTGAGGIRIDHIMGLFRLWWIPQGNSPKDGAYVTYDSEAILAVLALEAHRAGVLVIGEDLGTVEPRVRERLGELGVLGTSVLWFEQTEAGLRDPRDYRSLSLATLNTHDMHPSAGYLNLEDIELSEQLGLLDSDPRAVYAAERTARQTVLTTVAEAGRLESTDTMIGAIDDVWPVTVGLYEHLADTSAQLVGVSLADVVGERRTQNKPGTSGEYPNWTLPLSDGTGAPVMLDDLETGDRLPVIAAIMNAAGRMGDGVGSPARPRRSDSSAHRTTDRTEDDDER